MAETSISQLVWGSTASLFTAPHQSRTGVQTAMTSFVDGFASLAPVSESSRPENPGGSATWADVSAPQQASSDMGQVEAQTVPAEAQNPLAEPSRNTASAADVASGTGVESTTSQSFAERTSEQDRTRAQIQREKNSAGSAKADEKSASAESEDAEIAGTPGREAEAPTAAAAESSNTNTNTSAREEEAGTANTELVAARVSPERPAVAPRSRGRRNDSGQSVIKSHSSPASRVGNGAGEGRKFAGIEQTGVRGKLGNETGKPSAVRGVDSATRIAPTGNRGGTGQTAVNQDGSSHGTTSATPRGTLGSLNMAAVGEVGNGNNSARSTGKAAEAPAPSTTNSANTAKMPAHVRGVMAMTHTRGGNLTMKLQPESLGALRVQMSINQGQISVQFHTQTAEANALIRGSIESLRSALEAQGFRLEQVSVQPLNRSDANGQAPGSQENGSRGTGGSGEKHDAGGDRSRGFREEKDSESPRRRSGQSREEARSFAARLDAHEI